MAADRIEFVSDEDTNTVEYKSTRPQTRSTKAKSGKSAMLRGRSARCQASEGGDSNHSSGYGDKNNDDDYEAKSSDADSDDADEYSGEEKLIVPTALGNDAAIKGQHVFGFQTPRRAGSLAQAASEAVHVQKGKTPRSAKTLNGKTRKSGTKGKTPSRKQNQGNQDLEEEKATDQTKKAKSLRGRRPTAALRTVDDSDDELSDSSSGDEEASGYTNTEGEQTDDPSEMVQEYFFAHHSSKCLTSDRTLASLGTPLMDQEELSNHLQQVSSSHRGECVKLYSKYRKCFPKWIFQIRHGFNLLFYGLGSKRVLIDQLRTSTLQGLTQLVVNGFFPSITIKHILNTITEEVLEHDGAFKSVIDQTSFIKEMFNKGKAPGELFLIVHNIDGPMLRSKKSQTILSLLAEVPFIHIIASIDHLNAPLVWDQSMCCRFKWLWNDVCTFEPYIEETSYENSLLVQQSGALALSSMAHVMRSLTPNGRGIFLIIVKQQLAEKGNSSYIGFGIYELYTKCREAFLVNSEQTLRAQLTEFRDHKLIRSRKGPDGVEYLHIPLDASTLKQFLEDQASTNR